MIASGWLLLGVGVLEVVGVFVVVVLSLMVSCPDGKDGNLALLGANRAPTGRQTVAVGAAGLARHRCPGAILHYACSGTGAWEVHD